MADRSHNQTSTSLIFRAGQQDREAWQRLVDVYSPLVFHWCRSDSGLSSEDAADVMQEVFHAVAGSLGRFDRQGPGAFRGWLRTITANKVRDLIRKLKRTDRARGGSGWHQHLQELPESSSDEDSAAEQTLVVRRALDLLANKFKENNRQAFWMMTVEGYSAAECAEELDMTEQAVWQACYRIRRRLREEFADLLE